MKKQSKWTCKVSNDGNHHFKLVKPNYKVLRENTMHLSAEEYYKECDAEHERKLKTDKNYYRLSGRVRHWKCIYCGKRETDSVEESNEKIRKNIVKYDYFRNRKIEMLKMKLSGKTNVEISEKFNISRERVSQIIGMFGKGKGLTQEKIDLIKKELSKLVEI